MFAYLTPRSIAIGGGGVSPIKLASWKKLEIFSSSWENSTKKMRKRPISIHFYDSNHYENLKICSTRSPHEIWDPSVEEFLCSLLPMWFASLRCFVGTHWWAKFMENLAASLSTFFLRWTRGLTSFAGTKSKTDFQPKIFELWAITNENGVTP